MAELYKRIYKTLHEINELRRKEKLRKHEATTAQLQAIVNASEEIAKHLGFNSLRELNERTGNPEISLKVLLAHYRRMKTLLEFSNARKTEFPTVRKDDDQQLL